MQCSLLFIEWNNAQCDVMLTLIISDRLICEEVGKFAVLKLSGTQVVRHEAAKFH